VLATVRGAEERCDVRLLADDGSAGLLHSTHDH
jgi:hypothetical protein